MAPKQLDALLRRGLIGTLKYEIDLLAGHMSKAEGAIADKVLSLNPVGDGRRL
jgi:hypothetical protein